MGEHRHAAVPQLEGVTGRNDIVERHRLACGFCRRRCELQHLCDHLFVDAIHLVDIDVVDFVMLREIEACEVTLKTLRRFDVAAAEDVFRQEDIDVALDIERHGGTDLRRLDHDGEADPDALGLQHF